MPNDAKFGLLAGVLGVILAYVVLVNKPQQPATPIPPKASPKQPSAQNINPPKTTTEPPAPEKLPTELGSTPVVRTKKELDATPTSRSTSKDADLEP
jgi:hypothetical protein